MDREVVELIREDFTGGGGDDEGSASQGLKVAENIVASSLRSLSAEERGPVHRTFLLLGVFPELCTIPVAVLDCLAGLDEGEPKHGEPQKPVALVAPTATKVRKQRLKMRQRLMRLLQLSLIKGSVSILLAGLRLGGCLAETGISRID